MTFGSTFGRVLSPTFQPKSQATASAAAWWLAGGIAAANCIAAYQAKGAASYAASKINLNNPGTYNATDGATYPAWDAANGWKKTSFQYLATGITVANGQSLICRFSNATANIRNYCAGGGLAYGKGIALMTGVPSNKAAGVYSTIWYGAAPALTAGVMAITPKTSDITKWVCYVNGSTYITDRDINPSNFGGEFALCTNFTDIQAETIYVQAAAIYSIPLTSTQIAALTTAMAAL